MHEDCSMQGWYVCNYLICAIYVCMHTLFSSVVLTLHGFHTKHQSGEAMAMVR